MAAEKEQVYATLLLSDTYLPGALVLAHSLIDNGTTRKLTVLVTEDTVSREAISQLQTVYNYVIPVPRISNAHPNLHLMNRADLHSAFTKIALWKQTQFSKIVYVDADVVAYRAPDELFDIDAPFSAAPDIGWPDIFNSGVMVLEPSEAEYERLADLARRGASFDGADQGLLNQHFGRDYNRISFTYNVTPSAHYQYIPAFKHFQDSISMVHFIGSQKPWFQGRPDFGTSGGGDLSPHEGMIARWWSVYDRHYGKDTERTPEEEKKSELVKYFVKGEYWPPGTEPQGQLQGGQPQAPHQPKPSINEAFFRGFPPPERVTEGETGEGYDGGQHYVEHHEWPSEQYEEGRGGYPERHEHHVHREYHEERHHEHHEEKPYEEHHEEKHYERHEEQHHEHHEEHRGEQHHEPHHEQHHKPHHEQHHEQPHHEEHHEHREHHQHYDHHHQEHHHEEYQPQPPPVVSTWDAQWQPPPRGGRPEAESFPDTKYEMSRDITPFVPPERYPSPPRDMWYKVPEEPPAPPTEKPRPIFPWETHQAPPTRVFADYTAPEYTEEPKIASPEPPRFGAVPGGPTSPASETGRSVGFGEEKEVIETSPEEPPALVATPSAEEHYGEPHTPPPESAPGLAPPLPLKREEEPKFQASDFWASPSATNAWDEVPGIRRYIERVIDQTGLGGPRRYSGASRRQRQLQAAAEVSEGRRRGFFTATDFLSTDDRLLSLTPVPLRTGDRGEEVEPVGFPIPHSGDEGEEEEEREEEEEQTGKAGTATTRATKPTVKPRLAEAKGVPTQSDWVCVHGRRWGPADCLCDLTNVLRVHKNPVEQLEKLARLHRLDPQSVLKRLSAEEPSARSRDAPPRSLPPSSEGVLLHAEQQQQQQQQWWRRHSHEERTYLGYAADEEERRREREYYSWSRSAAAKSRGGGKVVVDTGTVPEGAPLLAPVPVKAGLPASKATTTTSRLMPGQIPPLLEPSEEEEAEEEEKVEKEGQSYRINGHPRSRYEQIFPPSSSRGKGRGKGKGKGIPEPSYTGPGAAWEPGAYIPTNVSGALPPEDEMDVLDT